jgi:hypothetical protein
MYLRAGSRQFYGRVFFQGVLLSIAEVTGSMARCRSRCVLVKQPIVNMSGRSESPGPRNLVASPTAKKPDM